MAAVITRAQAKDWIGIAADDTTQDSKLDVMIAAVDTLIKEYTEAEFTPQVVLNEVLDGTRSDTVVPKNSPIISVQALIIDVGWDGTGGTALEPTEYFVEKECVNLRTRVTPKGRGVIKINYTWGYAEVPAPVTACALLAVEALYLRKGRKSIGIASRSKEGESENYISAWDLSSGLPKEAMGMLDPYRSIEFPVPSTSIGHR